MQIKRFRSQCVVPSSLVAKSLGREAQPYISGRQMVGQNRVIASDRKSPDPHRLGQWDPSPVGMSGVGNLCKGLVNIFGLVDHTIYLPLCYKSSHRPLVITGCDCAPIKLDLQNRWQAEFGLCAQLANP